jgi:exodeoxyribonuclease V alpha subunit
VATWLRSASSTASQPPRAQEILAAYVENKGERDRVVKLKGWGLTDGQIARVVDQWGDHAEAELVKNPYSLMDAVDGFGWQRADQVAQRMGVKLDSPPRCSAALMHGLKEGAGHGNTYVSNGKLVSLAAVKYLGGVDETKVRAALAELEQAGKVVRHGVNIYLPKLAAAEATLAEAFSSRAQRAAKKGKAA